MLTAIDFYKADHRSQYPEGTEYVYSNFTPRSNKYAQTDKIVVFGIQGFIIKHLIKGFNKDFFTLYKKDAVSKYQRRLDNALGKGAVSVDHIEALHDLGYLPLHIKALPEGVKVSPKIPVLTVINTKPEFFWLVNYIESFMSAELWLPMTSASIANQYKKVFDEYAELTGTPLELTALQGHDFSFRGMAGIEAAKLSGAGHLTSFIGTDTVPAIDYVEDYYFANSDKEMVGCSVPATEHSVMCMGTKESEIETFRRLIQDLYPVGIVSIVSDTWDLWKVLTEYASSLKEQIESREPITDEQGNIIVPAKVVFRPDSGDPIKILTGYTFEELDLNSPAEFGWVNLNPNVELYKIKGKYYHFEMKGKPHFEYDEYTEAEVKGAVECLWETFGGFTTNKGYKQLDKVGLIYGDSITLERQKEILQRLADKGFASGNVVLGIGSFTYQYNTRDTYGFAMKATWGQVNGEGRNIFKDPITDDGMKKSATGLLRVELENGEYVLYDKQTKEQEQQGELKTVFLDGKLCNPTSLQDVRNELNN